LILYGSGAVAVTNDRILDAVKLAEALDDMPLDEAFEKIQCLLYKAAEQTEVCKSASKTAAGELRANEMVISATKFDLLSLLYKLLLCVVFPEASLTMLAGALDKNSTTLQTVITSDTEIVSELQRKGECARETLHELRTAQDFIQGQMAVPAQRAASQSSTSKNRHRVSEVQRQKGRGEEEQEAEHNMVSEAMEKFQRQSEQFAELQKECKQLQQSLRQAVDQVEDLKKQTEDLIANYDSKQREMENVHRENEGRTVWQQIRAWISWLSFGLL